MFYAATAVGVACHRHRDGGYHKCNMPVAYNILNKISEELLLCWGREREECEIQSIQPNGNCKFLSSCILENGYKYHAAQLTNNEFLCMFLLKMYSRRMLR